MRIYLCSFANKAISKSFLRLRKQAEEMNMFDEIYFYTESDLSKDFKKQFKKQLIPYSRGFGFLVLETANYFPNIRKDGCRRHITLYGCRLSLKCKRKRTFIRVC